MEPEFDVGDTVYLYLPALVSSPENHRWHGQRVKIVQIDARPVLEQTFYHVEWYEWVEGRQWTSASGFLATELSCFRIRKCARLGVHRPGRYAQ